MAVFQRSEKSRKDRCRHVVRVLAHNARNRLADSPDCVGLFARDEPESDKGCAHAFTKRTLTLPSGAFVASHGRRYPGQLKTCLDQAYSASGKRHGVAIWRRVSKIPARNPWRLKVMFGEGEKFETKVAKQRPLRSIRPSVCSRSDQSHSFMSPNHVH